MKVLNRHNVDNFFWKNWTEAQQLHFDRVYIAIHDEGVAPIVGEEVEELLTKDDFDRIAWNTAMVAATSLEKSV